jgi:hypothetical protein
VASLLTQPEHSKGRGGNSDGQWAAEPVLRVRLQQLLLRVDGLLAAETSGHFTEEHVGVESAGRQQDGQSSLPATAAVAALWAAAVLGMRVSPEGRLRASLLPLGSADDDAASPAQPRATGQRGKLPSFQRPARKTLWSSRPVALPKLCRRWPPRLAVRPRPAAQLRLMRRQGHPQLPSQQAVPPPPAHQHLRARELARALWAAARLALPVRADTSRGQDSKRGSWHVVQQRLRSLRTSCAVCICRT